jgi:hypothetical protein
MAKKGQGCDVNTLMSIPTMIINTLMSIPTMIINGITGFLNIICGGGVLGGTIIGAFGTQTLVFPTMTVSNPLALSSALITVSIVLLLMFKLK